MFDFIIDLFEVDIAVVHGTHMMQSRYADLLEDFRLHLEADDFPLICFKQGVRQRQRRSYRNIDDFISLLRKKERRRRLRCARQADNDNIGSLQPLKTFSIIMHNRKFDRFNSLEIALVGLAQQCRFFKRRAAEIGGESPDYRSENIIVQQFVPDTVLMDEIANALLHKREGHKCPFFPGLDEYFLHFIAGFHTGEYGESDTMVAKLNQRCAHDIDRALTGAVGENENFMRWFAFGFHAIVYQSCIFKCYRDSAGLSFEYGIHYNNSMPRILVISDSKAIEGLLKPHCAECTIVGYRQRDLQPAGSRLDEYDIAFIDLSHDAWRESIQLVRQRLPVIGFSVQDVAVVVEAMQLGASDVIEKALTRKTLEQVIGKHRRKFLTHSQGFDEIVGNSPLMQEVFSLVKKAALTESNVLITGESGTGKEPVARAIHRWSPRKLKSFMTINCSAIPDTLLESELFGFEKGSFTGANYTKKGILELADGGTVFFDEVGDVSPLFQTKVLRVIQEGEFMRVGGNRHHHVDVRFIAATNRDLKALCKKGTFREDLYYRLNVINIHLPPLRQRMEDVPLLVQHFIRKHGPKRKDILIRNISDDALNMLMNYQYPGNVRELENIIEQAVSFSTGPEILPSSLPPFLQQTAPRKRAATPKMREAVASFERELIWSALQEARGNISRAAQILGIYRQQLQRKIKQLKIAT